MDATRTQKITKSKFLAEIQSCFPAYTFTRGNQFSWDPNTKTITYSVKSEGTELFMYRIFHEIGHANLMHKEFKHDLELVKIEREAWVEAKEIANTFSIDIPDENIESSIDSYRDWLYARSLCPNCQQCGIQTSETSYSCVFCKQNWKVSASRMCRVSRRKIN
ncbi:hypothetical protein KC930_03150 [Candidatus Saccharibacteria bacterium]|nr:hypothetical protein [Candidatus Saccharibacteria bacterium]